MKIWVPGSPGTGGSPAIIQEVGLNGWESGAVSIPMTNGVGGYEFYVPATVAGVVCGLADNFEGEGYRSIDIALLFSRGNVSLVEFGDIVASIGTYTLSDRFAMWVQSGEVFITQGGRLVARRPSTLGGVFRLACSLYLKGDSVVNAWPILGGTGVGDATLAPVSALGVEGVENYGVAAIGPISAQGRARGTGVGDATLGGVQAAGGNKAFGSGLARLGPIKAYGEAVAFTPSWGTGEAYLNGVHAVGHGIVGEVGRSDASLLGVRSLAADRLYGTGSGDLEPILAFGAQAISFTRASTGSMRYGGGYAIYGFIRRTPTAGIVARLPSVRLDGRFGASWNMRLRPITLSASITAPTILRGEISLPSVRLHAAGHGGGTVEGRLSLRGRYALALSMGSSLAIMSPSVLLAARILAGSAITAALSTRGRYHLNAAASVQPQSIWALTGPSLKAVPSWRMQLTGPAIMLSGGVVDAVDVGYEAYAINITTGAVTQYTGFDFDNVLRFGDRFFGVRRDGVYELSGDTDNGEPILAQVKTFNTDFGKTNLKRVPFVYVVGEAGTDLQVGFAADKKPAINYPVGLVSEQGVQVGRAKAGLGLKGVYYSFTLSNTEGQDFQIDRLEAIVDATTVVKG